MTDFPDWQAPQAHANAISVTGAPLLSLSAVLFSASNTQIAGGGANAYQSPGVAVGQIGYEIYLNVSEVTAGTKPLVKVQVTWTDTTSPAGVTIIQTYIVAVAAQGQQHVVIGTGQSEGNHVQVTVTNLDSTAVNLTISMQQNSRVYRRHYWRTQDIVSVTGYTLPSHDNSSLIVCSASATVAVGTPVTFLLSLFTGTVTIRLHADTAPVSFTVNVLDPAITGPPDVFGAAVAAGADAVYTDVLLPRSQCTLVMTNSGTASATARALITASGG